MVNGEWCLSIAQVERLSLDPNGAQRLFTIYHSPFTSLLFAAPFGQVLRFFSADFRCFLARNRIPESGRNFSPPGRSRTEVLLCLSRKCFSRLPSSRSARPASSHRSRRARTCTSRRTRRKTSRRP